MHGNTNCIIEYLKLMGAKIQKTFNLKVIILNSKLLIDEIIFVQIFFSVGYGCGVSKR